MKAPKGYGKNYFTFASILAHSVAPKLQSRSVSMENHLYVSACEKEDDIDEPPGVSEDGPRIVPVTPCHCDCYYRARTYLSLKINRFIPRCPFYTTWFAFRRTGVHPPLFIL